MKERTEEIIKRIEGEKILHVGCVGEYLWLEQTRHKIWLHEELCKNHNDVIGMDTDKAGIQKMQANGYRAICDNMETFSFSEQFDCIVAAQMIHHVSNHGIALTNLSRHLKKNGKIIVTIPNQWWYQRLLLRLFDKNDSYNFNAGGHVCSLTPTHFHALIERIPNLEIREEIWIPHKDNPSSIKGFFWHYLFVPILNRILPPIFTQKNYLAVVKKKI